MAQKISVQLLCDVDHDGEDGADVKSVMIGFDGETAEVDLCAAHLEEYGEYLRPLIAAGRAKPFPKPGKTTTKAAPKADTAAVRAWAQANGVAINGRGRIPSAVLEQFHASKKKR